MARQQRGAIAVEMVLILPVLLLLVLGIVNFGYLFGQKLALNQAVREGARMAVVPGTNNGADVNTTAKIQSKVQGGTGGLIPGTVNVVVKKEGGGVVTQGCKSTGIKVGDQLRVEATYTTSGIIKMPLPVIPNTVTLRSTAVYRCEWQG
jgi:hypothetical protein